MDKLNIWGKKQGRVLLLVFGSLITMFVFIMPAFLDEVAAKYVVDSRSEWMILYTMIVAFYFKNREVAD